MILRKRSDTAAQKPHCCCITSAVWRRSDTIKWRRWWRWWWKCTTTKTTTTMTTTTIPPAGRSSNSRRRPPSGRDDKSKSQSMFATTVAVAVAAATAAVAAVAAVTNDTAVARLSYYRTVARRSCSWPLSSHVERTETYVMTAEDEEVDCCAAVMAAVTTMPSRIRLAAVGRAVDRSRAAKRDDGKNINVNSISYYRIPCRCSGSGGSETAAVVRDVYGRRWEKERKKN